MDITRTASDQIEVQLAVGSYIRWRRALKHAEALQQETHIRAGHLSAEQFGAYADQTTQYDSDHNK